MSDFQEFFDEAYNVVSNTYTTLEELRDVIRDISSRLQLENENLEKLQKTYDDIDRLTENSTIQQITSDDVYIILEVELNKAVALSPEFDHPIFLDGLMEVIRNPELVVITPMGSEAEVELQMNEIAGNVEEYLFAVEAVRDQLAGERPTKALPTGAYSKGLPPKMASHFWRYKYYSAGREGKSKEVKRKGEMVDKTEEFSKAYWDTMQARMELVNSPAPWWYLLNYGSGSLEKGEGSAYPYDKRTLFVENSQSRIESLYRRTYISVKSDLLDSYFQGERDLEKRITKLETLMEQAENLVEGMQIEDTETQQIYERLVEQVGEERIEESDRSRLYQLAQEIKAGSISNAERRFTLGRAGRRKDVTIRIKSILRDFGKI